MRPEALLAGTAVGIVLLTVAVAALVPGFLADPTDDDDRPARFDVTETTIEAGAVSGETATLETTAYIQHRGGPGENVTVVTRATSRDSGLVVDTTARELGTVDDGRERNVSLPVTVPREGGYEITTLLYVDGNRVDTASASVSGVAALTPPYADSIVRFHRFALQPSVEYTVDSVDDETVTLDVTSYLTNGGDDAESGLRLVVTARQADSNVVADRAEMAVGTIEPGRTAAPEVQLTVPDGYNYYLDATLWRDGVVLESTRAVANLDPEETIAANETRREVQFEASDFETDRPASDRTPAPTAAPEDLEGQSGFGVAVAVVALFSGLLAARRWSQ
jgi:PGF-CTERM protein